MSMIHEALKKTAAEDSKNSSVRITPVGHKRRSDRWRPFFILALVVLAAVPLFAGRILSPAQKNAPQGAPLGQFQVEEAPVPAAAPAPAFAWPAPQNTVARPFVLNGVVFSEAGSYCLINGLVLKQGDKVGGATIKSIASDTVSLDLNGETIVLSSDGS